MTRCLVPLCLATLVACGSSDPPGAPGGRGSAAWSPAAWSGQGTDQPGDPTDHDPPTLVLQTPERASILQEPTLTVRGVATDEGTGVETVTVQGESVDVAPDGSFEVELPLEDGITVLQTTAEDGAGHDVSDTRAVLAGTFAPQSERIDDALVARLGSSSFDVIAEHLSDVGEQTDFGAVAQQFNPIVDVGGSCLGAEVDVTSVSHSAVEADVTPTAGGVMVSVEIHDLVAQMQADYKVACLGGSAGITLEADVFRASAYAPIGLDWAGRFDVDLSNPGGQFEGFNLQVGPIPQEVLELFVSDIDDRVADFLLDEVQDYVPPMAESVLAEWEEQDWTVQVLGHELTFSLSPTSVSFNGWSGTIRLDTSLTIDGLYMGDYVSTPEDPPASYQLSGQGLRLAVADDVANQALAAFWAAGELDFTENIPEGSPAQGVFGANADRIVHRPLLPPMVEVDPQAGTARIYFGDIVSDVVDEDGESLAQFASSGSLEITAGLDGDFRLSLETGDIEISVVPLGAVQSGILTEEVLAAYGEETVEQMTSYVDQVVGAVPVPQMAESLLYAPSMDAEAGYLLLGADVL